MKVIKVTPQGYCYGVVRAINIAKKAAATQQKPIYILGDIVHNELVSSYLKTIGVNTIENKGVSRLDLLEDINEGTVIFTAHGVSPLVREKAKQKSLNMIDATCPEVMSTQESIEKYLDMDYSIIFIGKKGHPEAEACIEINREKTSFISKLDDINNITFNDSKYFIAYQSTLNTDDLSDISKTLEKVLENKIVVNNHTVCEATKARQQAIKDLKDVDFLIVVGDKNSNNSNKLVEISINHDKIPAKRIMSVNELDLETFKEVKCIAITSGASTPTALTKHIIKFFEQFDYTNKSTWHYTDFDIENM